MFVTNHALSGAVIGASVPDRPVVAFAIGLGSHLVLDAVPHWGCDWEAEGGPEGFYRVARRDGLLGLTVAGLALAQAPRGCRLATAAAITGAVLLDLDKPFDYLWGWNPFPEIVNRVHKAVQCESPDRLVDEFAWGGAMGTVAVLVGRWRARRDPRALEPRGAGPTAIGGGGAPRRRRPAAV